MDSKTILLFRAVMALLFSLGITATTMAQDQQPVELSTEETQLANTASETRGCPIRTAIEVEMPKLDEADRRLVEDALNLNGTHRFPVCAYEAKSDTNRHGKRRELYVPSNHPLPPDGDPDQIGWSLISVDGQTPSSRQLERYRHSGGALYPHDELVEMIDFARLEVAERTNEKVIFQTRPTIEFLEEEKAAFLLDHVTMTLVVEVESRRLDFLTNKLNAPFRRNAFMRVHEFDQYMEYTYVPEVGEVVLTELHMRADAQLVVVRREFFLYAELENFSCPVSMQPLTCDEPEAEAEQANSTL